MSRCHILWHGEPHGPCGHHREITIRLQTCSVRLGGAALFGIWWEMPCVAIDAVNLLPGFRTQSAVVGLQQVPVQAVDQCLKAAQAHQVGFEMAVLRHTL